MIKDDERKKKKKTTARYYETGNGEEPSECRVKQHSRPKTETVGSGGNGTEMKGGGTLAQSRCETSGDTTYVQPSTESCTTSSSSPQVPNFWSCAVARSIIWEPDAAPESARLLSVIKEVIGERKHLKRFCGTHGKEGVGNRTEAGKNVRGVSRRLVAHSMRAQHKQ